jgi:hypothetical protein
MPLPIGHALAGMAVQRACPGFFSANRWLDAFIFMFLANLPDADFIPGLISGRPNLYPHGAFHSLGAALGVAVIGAGFFCLKKRRADTQSHGRFRGPAAMIFLLFSSHLLLDLFALDFVAPFGLPLLWPFSGRYFIAARPLFINITRSSAAGDFFPSLFNSHNLAAALREVLILGSIALAAAWLRARMERSRRAQAGKGGVSGG